MTFGYLFGKKAESASQTTTEDTQPQLLNFSAIPTQEDHKETDCNEKKGKCKDPPSHGGLPSQGNKKTNGKPYRILALDGGGARGILQIAILKRIAEAYPPFLQQVDLFSGTSAGSINASALSVGKTPEELLQIWLDQCKGVFTESYWKRISSGNNLFGASYDAKPIKKMATDIVGDLTLRDVKKGILIPAFNLDPNDDESSNIPHNHNRVNAISGLKAPNSKIGGTVSLFDPSGVPNTPSLKPQDRRWFPEYFHNFSNSSNADTLLIDACLRSAAAPTYFPIYQGFVDGGVFANNPSLAAITSCICEGIDIRDICVLSISTGNNPIFIGKEKYQDGNWGVYEWGLQLIDLLCDSTSAASTHQSACLLGEQFYRVDPCLSKDIKLDDASDSTIKYLLEVANQVDLSPIIEWLKKFWEVEDNPKDLEASFMALGVNTELPPPVHSLEKEWLLL